MSYHPRKGEWITPIEFLAKHLASRGYWGRQLYKIVGPTVFKHRDGVTYACPSGFICDLASVFWRWRKTAYDVAAILHDFGYLFGFLFVVEGDTVRRQEMSRKELDTLFCDAAYTAGQPERSAKVFHFWLWVGGRFSWKRNRRRDCQYDKTDEEAAGLILRNDER